jgi:hypothetical protein
MNSLRLFALFLLTISLKSRAQVPVYNSYPEATAVLFLDFDGHTVSGTNWNMDGPIHCGPSNLNAEQVLEICNRMAEDFRPFNLNITTDSARYIAAPIIQRMRVIFTITSDWYGQVGGVAFTNSFSWGNNTPCFVFTALHQYNLKNIAEAASHEAGHTLGLRHQAMYDSTCNKITDYYSGTGEGIAGWAPIMGLGYYRNNTTWHNGPNPYGCTSEQDDLAIISGENNGFGYRTDDYTETNFSTAASIDSANHQLSGSGLIATNTDADLFQFAMPASGSLQLDVNPYSIAPGDEGSNLDVEVRLYDKNQALIQTYNPAEMLSVSIDTTLPKGTYYLAVSGASSPFSSSYASLGAYSIKGTTPDVTVLPLHKLQLKGSAVANQHRLQWDIEADEAVTKQVIEHSNDGNTFTPLALPAPDARQYSSPVTGTKSIQYRLHVEFEDGRSYYSNTVALQARTTTAKPQLQSNLIHTNGLAVSSPALYTYIITNAAGQRVAKGQVVEGSTTISTSALKKGLYIITFQNNTGQVSEKFMLQ